MPWWFWPMAALWTVPLIIVVWMVVAIAREVLADRRLARGEAEREARAAALCARDQPMFPLPKMQEFGGPQGAIPLDTQQGNPRARP